MQGAGTVRERNETSAMSIRSVTRVLDITPRLDRERKFNASQKGWIGQELARLPGDRRQ